MGTLQLLGENSGALRTPGVRRRLAVTLGAVVLFRLGQTVPLPGVHPAATGRVAGGADHTDQLRGLLDLVTGGGLFRLAWLPFGVLPVLLARMLTPALTRLHPRLTALRPEHLDGSRAGMILLMRRTALVLGVLGGVALGIVAEGGAGTDGGGGSVAAGGGVLRIHGALAVTVVAACVAAGTALVLWLSEWAGRRGLGDGVSVLLFAQVLAVLPGQLWDVRTAEGDGRFALVLAAALAALVVTTALVVTGRSAERRIPYQFAKRMIGRRPFGAPDRGYVPFVLSHRGFVPAVTAGLLLAPLWLSPLVCGVALFVLAAVGAWVAVFVAREVGAAADGLARAGAFVPGIRPGGPTADYLGYVRGRTAVVEVLGTGTVAVLPTLLLTAVGTADGYAFGGTSLLVVAGAALGAVGGVLRDLQEAATLHRYAARGGTTSAGTVG
ncbi:hypothetical protein [Kitasatospora sp. NPDC097643]|uniref:hypothetical protein n=1 Tax=Kitasatospora sp. NPDC097643 TaxID=3157230 RepID=UPI003320E078